MSAAEFDTQHAKMLIEVERKTNESHLIQSDEQSNHWSGPLQTTFSKREKSNTIILFFFII